MYTNLPWLALVGGFVVLDLGLVLTIADRSERHILRARKRRHRLGSLLIALVTALPQSKLLLIRRQSILADEHGPVVRAANHSRLPTDGCEPCGGYRITSATLPSCIRDGVH